ncbi:MULTISPECIES: hypothetical protein [Hyphomicrobiales]|jgi:hypothetical protein|uniref:hypothetical protein n=1 Tax=Hyphomicrobiales TaxID=356 RepID=UPI0010F70865|nr:MULTISPECIES: hypothetical protein [Mesorhizobium]MBA3038744.1 hypothetical protein [Rhizobiaceae bacterium]MBA4799786.1 hypothetical protein [Hyphomicrobiales bacterium]MBN9138735.1 hypothetical protein [Phyllobacterium sp.]MBN9217074.1 hypothetical protein [Mesorhizobium sp.]
MPATIRTAYGPSLLARLLAAGTQQQVDECAKAAWILNGEGLIADEEMEYLAPVIEHRRLSISAMMRTVRAKGCTRHCRPAIPLQKRAACWLRRRGLAKDCIIPTCLAQAFTVSKLAVLSVIARAVMERGQSTMSLPEIAARAGVGCTTARYAIRDAAKMGLISVSENRINGFWNRPNTIRIVCGRWLRWLKVCAASRAQKSARPAGRGDLSTPLRNLIPTIEIVRFSLRGAIRQGTSRPVLPPCWRVCLGSSEEGWPL